MKAENVNCVKKPVHIAVIGRDGEVEHHEVTTSYAESSEQAGKVVFPFQSTSVHSDAWKASEHTVLKKRTDRK